jgi:enamine deaminase RidA (YjgF/YER057c/UK114 family)
LRSYTNYNLGGIDDEVESNLVDSIHDRLQGALLAQVTVKHIQTDKSPIATGAWAGDTFYLSGQLGL